MTQTTTQKTLAVTPPPAKVQPLAERLVAAQIQLAARNSVRQIKVKG